MAFDICDFPNYYFSDENLLQAASGITQWFNIALRLEYRPGIVLEHVWSLRDRFHGEALHIVFIGPRLLVRIQVVEHGPGTATLVWPIAC